MLNPRSISDWPMRLVRLAKWGERLRERARYHVIGGQLCGIAIMTYCADNVSYSFVREEKMEQSDGLGDNSRLWRGKG